MTIRNEFNMAQDGPAGPVRANACNLLTGNVRLVAGTVDEQLSLAGKFVPLGSVVFVSRTVPNGILGHLHGEVVNDGLGNRVVRVTSSDAGDISDVFFLVVTP